MPPPLLVAVAAVYREPPAPAPEGALGEVLFKAMLSVPPAPANALLLPLRFGSGVLRRSQPLRGRSAKNASAATTTAVDLRRGRDSAGVRAHCRL